MLDRYRERANGLRVLYELGRVSTPAFTRAVQPSQTLEHIHQTLAEVLSDIAALEQAILQTVPVPVTIGEIRRYRDRLAQVLMEMDQADDIAHQNLPELTKLVQDLTGGQPFPTPVPSPPERGLRLL